MKTLFCVCKNPFSGVHLPLPDNTFTCSQRNVYHRPLFVCRCKNMFFCRILLEGGWMHSICYFAAFLAFKWGSALKGIIHAAMMMQHTLCTLNPELSADVIFFLNFRLFGPTGKQQHVLTRTLMLSLGLATLSVFYIFRQFLFQVLAGPVPFLADVQIWIFISGIYRRCIIHDPFNILLFLINGSYANYWFFDSKFFEPFASWFIIICSIQPSICIELARLE